ncbi:hypothetical protein [Dysosmobacter sp.]|uniref:hypothetical protein n=1 Tax=Dysosmobacter sp. TaxID=2591382 RepID=UPI002A856AEA|nr:hypothetical protein [Dysosmobacter sp.]MDY3986109.1 hypothetical protein [Dysosmobacter sp.]
MREQLISKIREIVSNEKFKMDAYFFCGFPSGTPNEKLLKACEKYLETVDNGQPDEEVTAGMIAELEAAAVAKSAAADNLVNNQDDIKEVLAHKELLFH